MSDRRIKKSKAALKQALLTIMKRKPLSKITIKELCDCADLNRSTFYANYTDIYALLFEIHNDIFHDMNTFLKESSPPVHSAPPRDEVYALTQIISYLKENQDIFQLMLTNNESNLFERHLTDYYMQKYVSKDADIAERYTFLYHSIGSFTLIHQWMTDGCPCSAEELARLILEGSKSSN